MHHTCTKHTSAIAHLAQASIYTKRPGRVGKKAPSLLSSIMVLKCLNQPIVYDVVNLHHGVSLANFIHYSNPPPPTLCVGPSDELATSWVHRPTCLELGIQPTNQQKFKEK